MTPRRLPSPLTHLSFADTDVLVALQRIEAGLTQEFPYGLLIVNSRTGIVENLRVVRGVHGDERYAVSAGFCLVCGLSDPLIWHHVYCKNRAGAESTNGTTTASDKGRLLGQARLCPNCHYYVHQLNPYSQKGR